MVCSGAPRHGKRYVNVICITSTILHLVEKHTVRHLRIFHAQNQIMPPDRYVYKVSIHDRSFIDVHVNALDAPC